MNYLLSVDGGGTKTEFCISDRKGNIVKPIFTESSNYKSVGIEEAYHNLQKGWDEVKKALNIDIEDIACSVWGISGCDSEEDYQILIEKIEKIGFVTDNKYLCNDGVLAFYAQADEPGIVIIAGTGSIVIGIDEKGSVQRAGGWGYNISDIGSGYWIGSEALKSTLLYCDGSAVHAQIHERIKEYLEVDSFEALPYKATGITDYYEIAKIAKLVSEQSEWGDETAKAILRKGACVLADFVKNIYYKLEFEKKEKIQIVFSGGVLQSEGYKNLLKEEIEKRIGLSNVSFSIQKNTPAYGGIRLAEKLVGKEG